MLKYFLSRSRSGSATAHCSQLNGARGAEPRVLRTAHHLLNDYRRLCHLHYCHRHSHRRCLCRHFCCCFCLCSFVSRREFISTGTEHQQRREAKITLLSRLFSHYIVAIFLSLVSLARVAAKIDFIRFFGSRIRFPECSTN